MQSTSNELRIAFEKAVIASPTTKATFEVNDKGQYVSIETYRLFNCYLMGRIDQLKIAIKEKDQSSGQ